MINTIKNDDGFIAGLIEWSVVDDDGMPMPYGAYVFISDLWIHKSLRGKKVLNKLIHLIDQDKRTQFSKYVYWQNQKHGERLTKSFSRKRLSKMGEE